jgi:hypothetical protein
MGAHGKKFRKSVLPSSGAFHGNFAPVAPQNRSWRSSAVSAAGDEGVRDLERRREGMGWIFFWSVQKVSGAEFFVAASGAQDGVFRHRQIEGAETAEVNTLPSSLVIRSRSRRCPHRPTLPEAADKHCHP